MDWRKHHINKLNLIFDISNKIGGLILDKQKNKDDEFDRLDTEIKEFLNNKAHQVIDDYGIKAKG